MYLIIKFYIEQVSEYLRLIPLSLVSKVTIEKSNVFICMVNFIFSHIFAKHR